MAGRAAVTAFNDGGMSPVEQGAWDAHATRLQRYAFYEAYYNNTAYSHLEAAAARHRVHEKLYKHIRGIYNPVSRQNDLLVSYIYGGALDMEHLTGGAIPLVFDNPALEPAIRQLWIWSRWGEMKSLYPRRGALLGDSAIKVVDNRASKKVRLEVLHPGKIYDVEVDAVGNITRAVIEYERVDDPVTVGNTQVDPKPYTYREIIDKDFFRTFKNGEPFAYFENGAGEAVSEWPNEYGFVPMVLAGHKSTGFVWSANAFNNALRKIDEINDSASMINDQIRKSVNVPWYFAGVAGPEQIDASSERDQMLALYGPAESQPYPMVSNLSLADALENIEKMLAEIERDMPELALQRIRESGGNLTAPGVRAAYSDAIGRIEEARGNYDAALVRAIQMAVSIGGHGGYANFGGFDLDSYDKGDEELYVKARPVINDSLSTTERLTALQQVSGQPPAVQRLMLKEMNYSEGDIEDVIQSAEERAREEVHAMTKAIFDFPAEDANDEEADSETPEEGAAANA